MQSVVRSSITIESDVNLKKLTRMARHFRSLIQEHETRGSAVQTGLGKAGPFCGPFLRSISEAVLMMFVRPQHIDSERMPVRFGKL